MKSAISNTTLTNIVYIDKSFLSKSLGRVRASPLKFEDLKIKLRFTRETFSPNFNQICLFIIIKSFSYLFLIKSNQIII